MRLDSLSRIGRSIAALAAFGVAAFAAQLAPAAQTVAEPTAHFATTEPASPPPMFLNPPFERVPAQGKAIFINIPSFELIAFEDGQEVMRSRVIVGSRKYQTPNLTAHTSVVRYRPTWTPTPTMIRDEGMSPDTRPPGKNNPLGLAAIRLDPGMLIYLHDTNNRKLYERENRALSHGCIRVEKWDEVAAFVLGIPLEDVHQYANGRRTFDMETEGVPVIVRYETLFPNEFGVMQQHADVYGRDAAYAKMLNDPAPQSNIAWDALPTSWSD